MNELPKIPWGKFISNFIWILGAAIIVAALGYQEFLAHLRKEIREEGKKGCEEGKNGREEIRSTGLSSEGFKSALFLGLTLIFGGASAAISPPFVSVILGIFSIVATVFFVKKIMGGERSLK